VLRRALLLIPMLVACNHAASPGASSPSHAVVSFAAGPTLTVRVADTDEERATGLMDVMALPEGDGMAFVYGSPSTDTYWMKDTLIPLSIAFVGSDGRIVSIRDMTPCRAEPCPTYAAAAPFTLAVEANLGWFREHRIAVGQRAKLEPVS
jgi:uncharacterized membrane protein (UPF0127 family)